jgi:adenine-specific DNA-methyltransferase
MNYLGSKKKLSKWILENIVSEVGDLSNKVFCDLFAGTGIVGQTFKPYVQKVISNDLEYYSFVLNKNYIENTKDLNEFISILNNIKKNIKPIKGFIYNNYCSPSNRLYFTDENGMLIDAWRIEIENYKSNKNLYYFLLTSLLESADKVANVASVYAAYLKKFKKTALNKLIVKPAEFLETEQTNEVYNKNALELITEINGDILYLDPPYNTRQYSTNYHILNIIAKYDTNLKLKGKTGLPENYNKSEFSSKRQVVEAFEYLIKNAEFKYIFMSYNNEGIIPQDTIKEIMSKYGKYKLIEKDYQRFTTSTENKNKKVKEQLHILIK